MTYGNVEWSIVLSEQEDHGGRFEEEVLFA